jgi:hypothetical protein
MAYSQLGPGLLHGGIIALSLPSKILYAFHIYDLTTPTIFSENKNNYESP